MEFFPKSIKRGVGAVTVTLRTIVMRDLEAFAAPARVLSGLMFLGEFQAALMDHRAECIALVLAASDATEDILTSATVAEMVSLMEAVQEANADFFDREAAFQVGVRRKMLALGLVPSSQDLPASASDTLPVLN